MVGDMVILILGAMWVVVTFLVTMYVLNQLTSSDGHVSTSSEYCNKGLFAGVVLGVVFFALPIFAILGLTS